MEKVGDIYASKTVTGSIELFGGLKRLTIRENGRVVKTIKPDSKEFKNFEKVTDETSN